MRPGDRAHAARPRAALIVVGPPVRKPAALTRLPGCAGAIVSPAEGMMIIIPLSGRVTVFSRALRQARFTGD
jgi:hypothetical protein